MSICKNSDCYERAAEDGYCLKHEPPAAEAKASPTYYLRTYERGNVGNPCHYCGADRPQHGEDLRCPPRAPKSESSSSRSGAAAEGSKSSSPIPSGGGEVESLREAKELILVLRHQIRNIENIASGYRTDLAAARARIRDLEEQVEKWNGWAKAEGEGR